MRVVLVDTNVVTDFLSGRLPFCYPAAEIFELAELDKIVVCISPLSLVTLYYLLKAHYKVPHILIIQRLQLLCSYIKISTVSANHIFDALTSPFNDFEDAVLYYSTLGFPDVDTIVTRNAKDFTTAQLAIQTPEEFLISFRQTI